MAELVFTPIGLVLKKVCKNSGVVKFWKAES